MKARTKAKEPRATDLETGQAQKPGEGPDPEHVAKGRVVMEELANSLWLPAGLASEEQGHRVRLAYDRLEALAPSGPAEGMLAIQMIATHSAAMDCLRRAMIDGQTFEGRDLNLKHAAKLLSLYARQLEVLDKHRGKGQQKVTVEHVHVAAGGQAIVGNVEAGGRRQTRQDRAIEHSPGAPLETPAPAAIPAKGKG